MKTTKNNPQPRVKDATENIIQYLVHMENGMEHSTCHTRFVLTSGHNRKGFLLTHNKPILKVYLAALVIWQTAIVRTTDICRNWRLH